LRQRAAAAVAAPPTKGIVREAALQALIQKGTYTDFASAKAAAEAQGYTVAP
jgi:hypothetical protein